MHIDGTSLLLTGTGPYPIGQGDAALQLLLLPIAVGVVVYVMYRIRRSSASADSRSTPWQLWKRIAGFVLGCLLVAVAVILIDALTTRLEFTERTEVSEDGTLAGSGIERSIGWYRVGRAVHVLSMLAFIASGLSLCARTRASFLRDGVSWGIVIAAVWALLVG